MNVNNIILVILDAVRRDFFYKNISDFKEIKDFVDFGNCYSIYTSTCTSHYSIFFGDYFNRARNESFPAQLNKLGFKNRSFCNGAIITGYPLKEIVEEEIKDIRPFRDKMIKDLGIIPEFDWKREMFGSKFEDYHGCADDEERDIPEKWKFYIRENKGNKNFIFLHFWSAHYIYGINDFLDNKIEGKNYHTIARELIRRIKNNELTDRFLKDVYSRRVNELINVYLRMLIEELKENDMYQESLIIITSDHGEGLGDIGEDYNEIFFDVCKTVFTYYNSLRRRVVFLPKIRKRYYKWDFETFYHNGDHELQKEIPLLVKFPNNEFGGKKYDKKVTLFDIIHTIDNLIGNKLDIKKDYGRSLYSLLVLGDEGEFDREQSKYLYDSEERRQIEDRLRALGYT